MERNYSSIYNLKNYLITSVAPKYFNMDEVNDLNVGLLGFITEILGTIGEDNFNTTTTYLNEIFPNKAILPETIYNTAAMFQDGDIFAKPAEMVGWLFVLEDDILNNATISGNQKEFFIDSDLNIHVENIQFMLDYDIRISYVTPNDNTILYTAMYDRHRYGTSYTSSLDTDNTMYVKSKVVTYNNQRYLALQVKLHQVSRYSVQETVINNDVINAPHFKVSFNGDISSFEVFCKEPDENNYVQLEKFLLGSAPKRDTRFCYYRLTDENELEVTFSLKDGYYKPKFGSDIIIDYTTTLGTKGEFELYTGTDIVCVGKSETYSYNDRLVIFCITQSPSQFAKDKMSLYELSIRNVENMSTVKSYTTENDLDMYFSRFTNVDNVKMYTIKKRNDYQDRLFSTFGLYRDSFSNIIKTNTVRLIVDASSNNNGYTNSFDKFVSISGTTSRYIPAGSIFKYDIDNGVIVFTGLTMADYADNKSDIQNESFVYATPFVIYMTQNPSLIGYYLNTLNNIYVMDYEYINTSVFVQFLCNSLGVERNAIIGTAEERSTYNVSLLLSATTDTTTKRTEADPDWTVVYASDDDNEYILCVIDDTTGEIVTDGLPYELKTSLSIKMYFGNNKDSFIELFPSEYDKETRIMTLRGKIVTDDYITAEQFRITNLQTSNPSEPTISRMIDMYNSVIHIETAINNTITNRYTTIGDHVTFIKPLSMCKSNVTYNKASIIDTIPEESRPTDETELNAFLAMVDTIIDAVPVVSASTMQDNVLRTEFFDYYSKQYYYIEDILDNITNNYNIDLKFYNTYGPSKNFRVEDDSSSTNTNPLIDSVNIGIRFRVKPNHGVDTDILIRDVKYFIKSYIEDINNTVNNSIYISNLIRALENEFDTIRYIKFAGINGIQNYGLETQAIENDAVSIDDLTYAERRNFVPEYLTIDLDDIDITIL